MKRLHIYKPIFNTLSRQQTVRWAGQAQWNALCDQYRKLPRVSLFKKAIINDMFSSYV